VQEKGNQDKNQRKKIKRGAKTNSPQQNMWPWREKVPECHHPARTQARHNETRKRDVDIAKERREVVPETMF